MNQFARHKEKEYAPPPPLANIDAERATIGKILIDSRVWFDISDRLLPDHFADQRHKAIYKALQTLAAKGSPLIRQLVPSVIGDAETDEIGLPAYLAALIAE